MSIDTTLDHPVQAARHAIRDLLTERETGVGAVTAKAGSAVRKLSGREGLTPTDQRAKAVEALDRLNQLKRALATALPSVEQAVEQVNELIVFLDGRIAEVEAKAADRASVKAEFAGIATEIGAIELDAEDENA